MRGCRIPTGATRSSSTKRKQRDGFLARDCQRLVNQDRNVFAACMVATGDADAIVTGTTRSYSAALEDITMAIDPVPGRSVFGLSIVSRRAGTVLVADTAIHERPDAETLAAIARGSAAAARRLGWSRASRSCPSPPSAIRRAASRAASATR